MSLKQQQRIDVSHLFSDQLMLFLNNASRSPIPTSHQRIIQDYMTAWHNGQHEPYRYNFEHADAFMQQLHAAGGKTTHRQGLFAYHQDSIKQVRPLMHLERSFIRLLIINTTDEI